MSVQWRFKLAVALPAVCLLKTADLPHNASDALADLAAHGPGVRGRFVGGRERKFAYWRRLSAAPG